MSDQKSSFLIPVIGTAVIIAGGLAVYMYLKGSPISSNPLTSAKLVPGTALMATYIDTNPEFWNKLQQFGTPEARSRYQALGWWYNDCSATTRCKKSIPG